MHPLDVVKTRFQVQGGPGDPNRYNGLRDCFKQMYKAEKLGGFYKGILPPILAETPKRATKFFTFEQYKRMFSHPDISLPLQRSTWSVAREIIRKRGLGTGGMFRGLTATLGRHGVWNCIYFGLYHSVRTRAPPDLRDRFAFRFALGFVAGTLASVANIPFDVAKSRIQGRQPASGRIYHGCFQSMALVYRNEGFSALYKGLVPKVMRLGPGGAIMLMVYEHVFDFLQARL